MGPVPPVATRSPSAPLFTTSTGSPVGPPRVNVPPVTLTPGARVAPSPLPWTALPLSISAVPPEMIAPRSPLSRRALWCSVAVPPVTERPSPSLEARVSPVAAREPAVRWMPSAAFPSMRVAGATVMSAPAPRSPSSPAA